MFLWNTPYGRKTFQRTEQQQEETKVLAKNQGLYNGFLAAGLIWSLVAPESFAFSLKVFFLACVVVAGVYGGATASKKILYIQAGPALLAMILLLMSRA